MPGKKRGPSNWCVAGCVVLFTSLYQVTGKVGDALVLSFGNISVSISIVSMVFKTCIKVSQTTTCRYSSSQPLGFTVVDLNMAHNANQPNTTITKNVFFLFNCEYKNKDLCLSGSENYFCCK